MSGSKHVSLQLDYVSPKCLSNRVGDKFRVTRKNDVPQKRNTFSSTCVVSESENHTNVQPCLALKYKGTLGVMPNEK